jgi:hypothetical protein
MMVMVGPFADAQAVPERQAFKPGNTPQKVAIIPVVVHSPENLGFLREGLLDMLSSRVELNGRVAVLEKGRVKKALAQFPGEMDNETARKLGQELGVDFIVYGSLTKLGDSASLDLKVLEVQGEKAPSSVYVQANKMEEIVGGVDSIARNIDERILGYSLAPVVAEKKAAPEGKPEGAKEVAAIPPIMGFRPRSSQEAMEFWRSQNFSIQVVGMGIGDLDGDGKNEVVMIDETNLYIYSWENEIRLIKKIEGGKFDRYVNVDVADIRKTGKAEIFVTNIQGTRLSSLVVAHQDGKFKVIAKELPWFFRIIDWGQRGEVLLGQGKGMEEGLVWPIYEMGWDGKGYKDVRQADLPRGLTLNGFSPFTADGNNYYAYIDSDFRLKVMDPKGKVIWRSKETYGSDVSVRIKPMGNSYSDSQGDDLFFVNVRLLSRGSELYILKNISPVGELFKRARMYTKGEVQRLKWTGGMFMETWRSQAIQGYLADFQFQRSAQAEEKALIVAVSLAAEGLIGGEKSSALMISRIQATN